jgi:hypothetical protein
MATERERYERQPEQMWNEASMHNLLPRIHW